MLKVSTTNCTGCGACENICPLNAIKLEENSEGFSYPNIDSTKCTNCGMCEKVCPIKNHTKHEELDYVYAITTDDEIRMKSSSGGAFTLLATEILQNNGYVCGASYSKDFKSVEHIIISSVDELYKLNTSKYIQSNINNIYKKIKELLNKDFEVLFSGTPCQVAGLNNFLGKDYTNLTTIDILCHGVPSPLVWRKYLEKINPENKTIKSINFRDKAYGTYPLHFSIKYSDGNTFIENSKKNPYFKGFLKNLTLRKSCYNCKYATLARTSDITLGDFWKLQKFDKKLNDNKGYSAYMPNTEKGKVFLDKISKNAKLFQKIPVKYLVKGNPTLKAPPKPHTNRNHFFNLLNTTSNITALLNEHLENLYYDGIITNIWSSNNYGAILTAYALQQYFKSKGQDYRILDYTPKHNLKKHFEDFTKKYLNLTHPVNDLKDLVDLNNYTENFVVGSDQVFKDEVVKKTPFLYLLTYTDFSKHRIAFSASFGKDSFEAPQNDFNTLKRCYSRFDAISVRELSGVDLCREKFNLEAKHILDPVFLTDKCIFERLVDKNCNKYKNKLVYYTLDATKEIVDKINKVAEAKGLEALNIAHKGLSVEEFLTAIHDCECFITDSFHGCCFAIIFNKAFLCLVNSDRGSARFDSLAKTFDISKNFVSKPQEITLENIDISNIDYNKIEKIISDSKEIADKWYNDVFNNPKPKTNVQISNEFDFVKYGDDKKLRIMPKTSPKDFIFSIKKGSVRITLQILGIKIHFKKR